MSVSVENGSELYYLADVERVFEYVYGRDRTLAARVLRSVRRCRTRAPRALKCQWQKNVVQRGRGALRRAARVLQCWWLKTERAVPTSSKWSWFANALVAVVVALFLVAWFRPKALPAEYASEITEMVGLVVILIGTIYIGLGVALDRDELRSLRLVKMGKKQVQHYVPDMLAKASYKFNEGMFIVLLGTICLCFKIVISIAHAESNRQLVCTVEGTNSQAKALKMQSGQNIFCVVDDR